MSLPLSARLGFPSSSVKEVNLNVPPLLSGYLPTAKQNKINFKVSYSRLECWSASNVLGGNLRRNRRMVKVLGLVDKLGKKLWREESSDSDDDDEDDNESSTKNLDEESTLDDEEERREWRKKIREVISQHPDIDEEVDLVEKRKRMQKLLSEYQLVVNEDDPDWPEDADGRGFNFDSFFDKITIKNVKKEDEDGGYDSENEVVWQDDNYIRPIKDLKTAEWEEAVFKDISPLIVFVHNRYRRPKENESCREELEKAIHIIWNCRLPSPRCVAVDAVVEVDLVSALKVSVFPEVIFTKAGKILYREKAVRTADELSKIMAFFYYGAAKPPVLDGVESCQEPIPSAIATSGTAI